MPPVPPLASPPSDNSKSALLRPVLACGGALLIGAIIIPLITRLPVGAPKSSATTSDSSVASVQMALPLTSTALVQRSAPPGQFLRGSVTLATDITGKARVTGEVARWVVEPGTHVKAGDSIVEVSSGTASRPVPLAEASQNQAEKAQIAADNARLDLAQQAAIAQAQLRAAQDRVERAQQRVTETRALVKRLLAGERVAAPKPNRALAPAPKPRKSAASNNPLVAAASSAQKKATSARQLAASAIQNESSARSELSAAQDALKAAQKKAETAQTNVTAAETKFAAKTATADEVQSARSAAEDAQNAIKAAQSRIEVATADVEARGKDVKKAVAAAQLAEEQAAAASKKAEDAGQNVTQDDTPDTPASTDTNASNSSDSVDGGGSDLTAQDAAKMVEDALNESKLAAHEADRLRARVDTYQSKANRTKDRIEDATQDLQKAQQKVLDSVPRPTFTSTVAPVDGVVTWISRLAQEVSTGQSVFGLSRGTKQTLRFEDSSDAWKKMQVGQVIPVFAQTAGNAATPSGTPSSPATQATPESTPPTNATLAAPTPSSVPIQVKITRISPPEGNSGAIIECEGPASGTGFDAATQVWAAVASSTNTGQGTTLTVPTSALLRQPDAVFVAVLDSATDAPKVDSAPTDTDAGTEKEAPGKEAIKEMKLHWVTVQTGRDDGLHCEIKSGLEAGQRIVSDPSAVVTLSTPQNPETPLVKLTES